MRVGGRQRRRYDEGPKEQEQRSGRGGLEAGPDWERVRAQRQLDPQLAVLLVVETRGTLDGTA